MSFKQKVLKELHEIWIVTSYFFICFLVILTLKKLLLAEYQIKIMVLHTALIAALITAKVVILLDKTPFGSLFDSQRLIFRVLWRTVAYTAIVFIVTLAEHLFEYYQEQSQLSLALQELWQGRDLYHFLALNISVGLSLLLYNFYIAIDQSLGRGALKRALLSR